MSDEIAPAAAPAAAEPAAPAVAPVAPAEPAAPAAPVAPTAEEAAAAADAAEWDEAADEIFPGLKSTQKPKKDDKKPDEPAKPDEKVETPKAPAADEIDPNETPEQKAEREAKAAADEEAAGDENEEIDTSARDTRLAARENARQVEVMKSDVRKEMFANVPTVLQDGDGDPIRSVDDVMRLINPRTNEAFTEEEAGMWLLSAQQKFNQSLQGIEQQIETIAEVNVDLKDQADAVTYRYGALLKEMPELRDELWAEYEKTLEKDPESGIITKMPVSLENFYEIALRPYATVAQKAEADGDAAAKTEADAKAAEDAKKAEAEEKAKKRADRSDIYGGGKVDDMDEDEKEWADAATAVFGPLGNKK